MWSVISGTRVPLRPFWGEREGPVAQRREGEVGSAANRLVGPPHPALSPGPVWTGEMVDGCSETWWTHPIGIFGLLGRGWGAVVGEVDHVAAA
jgi:hypothetical protein